MRGGKKVFSFAFIPRTATLLPRFELLIFTSTKQTCFTLILIGVCKVICTKHTNLGRTSHLLRIPLTQTSVVLNSTQTFPRPEAIKS